jgi:CBS domain-containing protein
LAAHRHNVSNPQKRRPRRGHHIRREYSIDPFLQTRVKDIMAQPVHTLAASMPAAEVVALMTAKEPHRHKSYPVVDDAEHIVGIISRSDILRWAREDLDEGATVADLASNDDVLSAYADDLVGDLADRMVADVGRVPILDRRSGKVVGLVARRDVLGVRARLLREESQRARLLRLPLRAAERS